MLQCSLCKISLSGIAYRFEQCSAHSFCNGCLLSKGSIQGLNCIDCNRILNVPRLINKPKVCFYCQSSAVLLTCDNYHTLCIDCVQSRETNVKCYDCYIKIVNFCSSCRIFPALKTPIPVHPCHSKCSECFKNQKPNSDCLFCIEQCSSNKNLCRLCNKRLIAKKSCLFHGLCLQCIIILQSFNSENYKQSINCRDCINGLNFIDFTNMCSICEKEDRDLIPIIGCLNNHKCCFNCLKSNENVQHIACRDCRVYFKLRLQRKSNCCIFCYYNSKSVFKIMCSRHYICSYCSDLIYSIPLVKQQKLINCQECLNLSSISEGYETAISNYKTMCQECKKIPPINIGCKSHNICKICLKFKMNNILKNIGNCYICNEFNAKGCRVCFALTDKPRSLNCSYKHIYCLYCITLNKPNFAKEDEGCVECSAIVINDEFMKNKRCMQCRVLMNPSSDCNYHSICIDCLLHTNENIIKKITNCIECMECQKYNCFNCRKYNTDLLFLIGCKAKHVYCETCFRSLKKSCNIKKCEDCLRDYLKNEMISIRSWCSRCNSVENSPIVCNTHSYCLKCYPNVEYNVLNGCTICLQLFHKYCINCLSEFNSRPKLFFPACEKNHFYCEKCFDHLNISKSIRCRSCNQKEKKFTNACDLCFRREGKSKLCRSHLYCEVCIENLNKLKRSSFIILLVCSLCRTSFENKRENSTLDKDFCNKKQNNFLLNQAPPGGILNADELFYEQEYLVGPINKGNHTDFNYSSPGYTPLKSNTDLIMFPITEDLSINKFIYNQNTGGGFLNKLTAENYPMTKSNVDGTHQVSSKIKRKVKCKMCNEAHYRLKCNHAHCLKCFKNAFFIKFDLFIKSLIIKNDEALKTKDYSISCLEPNCNNKYCLPFDLFYSVAKEFVDPYYPDYPETTQKFLYHYEGFFEGINYTFGPCNRCNIFVGKAKNQLCLWCNH